MTPLDSWLRNPSQQGSLLFHEASHRENVAATDDSTLKCNDGRRGRVARKRGKGVGKRGERKENISTQSARRESGMNPPSPGLLRLQ